MVVGHSYKAIHVLNTPFPKNLKGQQGKVSLMVELKHFRCSYMIINFLLLGRSFHLNIPMEEG